MSKSKSVPGPNEWTKMIQRPPPATVEEQRALIAKCDERGLSAGATAVVVGISVNDCNMLRASAGQLI